MTVTWQATLAERLTSALVPIRRVWNNLSPTDQRALRLGGVALLVLLALGSLFLRAEDYFARQERIALKEQQLLQLQRGGSVDKALGAAPTNAAELGQSLQRVVGESIFAVEFLQQIDQGWQLEITEAPFQDVIDLERKLAQHGIAVARYRLERGTEPELVSGYVEWHVFAP